MLNKNARRKRPEVNAGSMADIAFLLLIFFLVTTTIEVNKGILAKLPKWTEEEIEVPLPDNRVFSVKVNAQNQILVEGELLKIEHLRETMKLFITNPQKRDNQPNRPKDAVISLQNDRGTAYKTYLSVYNEVIGGYNDLRDEAAEKQFGKPFKKLKKAEKEQIIDIYPMVISEAEPTEYGEEE